MNNLKFHYWRCTKKVVNSCLKLISIVFFYLIKDRFYYNQLKQNFLEHDLLVDTLMYKVSCLLLSSNLSFEKIFSFSQFFLQDVKLTAANDDCYFVFEDYLYQVRWLTVFFSFNSC